MRTFRCGTTTVRHVRARSSSTAAAQETGTDSIQSGSVVGSARLGELRHEMQQRKGCPICHSTYKYNTCYNDCLLSMPLSNWLYLTE